MHPAFWTVMGIGWAVNLVCAIHMWARAPGGAGKKVLFTVVGVVPLLGGLAYGGMYTPPPPQAPTKGTHVPRGAIHKADL